MDFICKLGYGMRVIGEISISLIVMTMLLSVSIALVGILAAAIAQVIIF